MMAPRNMSLIARLQIKMLVTLLIFLSLMTTIMTLILLHKDNNNQMPTMPTKMASPTDRVDITPDVVYTHTSTTELSMRRSWVLLQ